MVSPSSEMPRHQSSLLEESSLTIVGAPQGSSAEARREVQMSLVPARVDMK